MLKSSGRRVALSSPFAGATLPNHSRLHVMIPTSPGHAGAACCESALSAPDLHRHFPLSAIDQRALSASDGLQTA